GPHPGGGGRGPDGLHGRPGGGPPVRPEPHPRRRVTPKTEDRTGPGRVRIPRTGPDVSRDFTEGSRKFQRKPAQGCYHPGGARGAGRREVRQLDMKKTYVLDTNILVQSPAACTCFE